MIIVPKLEDLLVDIPDNLAVQDAIIKCYTEIKNHNNIVASISGGSDSDVMLDLVIRCGGKDKTTFIFFNTGLEYEATKRQIQYLQEKYGIEIVIKKAIKPIPLSCRQYGVPFLSKRVSDYIARLQKHNFKWEDKPFEELYQEYPKCKVALRWWCNLWGEGSQFNIQYNKWLKEFMIANPPTFKISNKCCHYAKKLVVKRFIDEGDFDMNMSGVRKAEGGARATAYKNCFTKAFAGTDQYRPLFWLTKSDKAAYEDYFDIQHSDCYTIWGMTRTGCSGCPFGRNFEEELQLAEKYEPKMYTALNKVFGNSYEYTRKYREFQKKMDEVQRE